MQEKEAESTYIEVVTKNGKIFIIGSLYRAPNTKSHTFTEHIKCTIAKIKFERGSKEIIVGMDHNMDLLKMS